MLSCNHFIQDDKQWFKWWWWSSITFPDPQCPTPAIKQILQPPAAWTNITSLTNNVETLKMGEIFILVAKSMQQPCTFPLPFLDNNHYHHLRNQSIWTIDTASVISLRVVFLPRNQLNELRDMLEMWSMWILPQAPQPFSFSTFFRPIPAPRLDLGLTAVVKRTRSMVCNVYRNHYLSPTNRNHLVKPPWHHTQPQTTNILAIVPTSDQPLGMLHVWKNFWIVYEHPQLTLQWWFPLCSKSFPSTLFHEMHLSLVWAPNRYTTQLSLIPTIPGIDSI